MQVNVPSAVEVVLQDGGVVKVPLRDIRHLLACRGRAETKASISATAAEIAVDARAIDSHEVIELRRLADQVGKLMGRVESIVQSHAQFCGCPLCMMLRGRGAERAENGRRLFGSLGQFRRACERLRSDIRTAMPDTVPAAEHGEMMLACWIEAKERAEEHIRRLERGLRKDGETVDVPDFERRSFNRDPLKAKRERLVKFLDDRKDEGLSNREVSRILGVDEAMVRKYRKKVAA